MMCISVIGGQCDSKKLRTSYEHFTTLTDNMHQPQISSYACIFMTDSCTLCIQDFAKTLLSLL